MNGHEGDDTTGPPRVVVDTNVLVGAFYNPGCAGARVLAACLDGRLRAVVTPAVRAEYAFILPRAVRRPGWKGRLARLLEKAVEVEPADVGRVVPEDPADDALFAAAVAGGAAAVVTNDAPVLALGSFRGVAVLRPSEFEAVYLNGS